MIIMFLSNISLGCVKNVSKNKFFYAPKTYIIIDSYLNRSWIVPILWIQCVLDLLAHLSSSAKVSFCDRSSFVIC